MIGTLDQLVARNWIGRRLLRRAPLSLLCQLTPFWLWVYGLKWVRLEMREVEPGHYVGKWAS